MKIILMHENVVNHDAIGNDIERMFSILSETRECYVYAQTKSNKKLAYLDRDTFLELIRDPENLIIYHHSVYWKAGEELLKQAKCRIIFRYHNITPESFYFAYNTDYFKICRDGRFQTLRLQQFFPDAFWICDSEYNARDLWLTDRSKIAVCPPFHKLDEWGSKEGDAAVAEELRGEDAVRLLFVGRIAPNKGYQKAIDILARYCRLYDGNIKIRFIGKKIGGLESYTELIEQSIKENGLEEKVQFIGEINDEKLISYYRESDLMLCCSEHEGFCVPIAESQYFGLPIVALRSTAVPETLGAEQVLLGGDPSEVAAAIRVISQDPEKKAYLAQKGRENYEQRFSFESIKKSFLTALEKALTAGEEAGDIPEIQKRLLKTANEFRYKDVMSGISYEIKTKGLAEGLTEEGKA